MFFCPPCGALLVVENKGGVVCLNCNLCPYIYRVDTMAGIKIPLEKKSVEPIFGGKEAWENAPKIGTRCPACHHDRAYYHQIQIRSADEPMTTFYKCIECGVQWNDD